MAEENIKSAQEEVEVPTDSENKPSEAPETTEVAPEKDEPTEAPTEEDISDVLALLNVLDSETGGSGEIKDVPKELRNSVKYLYEKLLFVRELFEDPLWKAILDDLADQKEDGKTPSVDVAIARNIPIAKLQELADNEDYEGAQGELSGKLESEKAAKEDDAMLDENFEASKAAGQEYAKEMGYDEDETNALFQVVLDLFNIMGDGKLTKEEFAKVDKMRNYDKDTEGLKAQIEEKSSAKEVLPDQASIEAATKPKPAPEKQKSAPGLGSLAAYANPVTDITQVKGRNRRG